MVGVVFVDLSKAFDTISHNALLSKLSSFGIVEKEHKWFETYLFHRQQHVCYESTNSDVSFEEFGVPQGSILGPLLFILF